MSIAFWREPDGMYVECILFGLLLLLVPTCPGISSFQAPSRISLSFLPRSPAEAGFWPAHQLPFYNFKGRLTRQDALAPVHLALPRLCRLKSSL